MHAPFKLLGEESLADLNDMVLVRGHQILVDLDPPGPSGNRTTERCELWFSNLEVGAVKTGQKAVGLSPFQLCLL